MPTQHLTPVVHGQTLPRLLAGATEPGLHPQQTRGHLHRLGITGFGFSRDILGAAAARAVINAYQEQRAEPWLAAYLLGCIGHEVGYHIVRKLLLEGTPSASGYVGKAMAALGGRRAADDLVNILTN